MVAHFTMRTHGVNQEFRLVEGIWLHRNSHQIRFCFLEKDLFYITCSELPCDISTMAHVAEPRGVPVHGDHEAELPGRPQTLQTPEKCTTTTTGKEDS